MYALVSPEAFLILLLYRLNLSQFCSQFIWTGNYLIKKIIFQTVVDLLFWFGYRILLILVLTMQSNNSYHPEKRRAMKFIILFLVLLLQFKVMLSSDQYKNMSPRFLRLIRGFGQKIRNLLKNFSCKIWK